MGNNMYLAGNLSTLFDDFTLVQWLNNAGIRDIVCTCMLDASI